MEDKEVIEFPAEEVTPDMLRDAMMKNFFEVLQPLLKALAAQAREDNGSQIMNEVQVAANFFRSGVHWYQDAIHTAKREVQKA